MLIQYDDLMLYICFATFGLYIFELNTSQTGKDKFYYQTINDIIYDYRINDIGRINRLVLIKINSRIGIYH